ncbi:MAG: DUF7064 domain-containing protein [Acidimicrobiales bacterium]
MPEVPASDERRHPAVAEPHWSESWYFDFATADGALGGYVRLGLVPGTGRAWYWAHLVREGLALVAVRDHDVALPPEGGGLEVRAEGLWAELVCETPLEHWSLGLEAFGVELEDPAEAYRGERGMRVPFGLDLEWEGLCRPYPYPGVTRYEQPCTVHGTVLVGDERIEFDGFGERDHSWGPRDWWAFGWCWTSGHLEDGSTFHGVRPFIEGVDHCFGFTAAPGAAVAETVQRFDVDTTLGADGLPSAAAMTFVPASGAPIEVEVAPVGHAPVLLESSTRTSRFPRSLCRYTAADGRTGVGWTEWNQPVN